MGILWINQPEKFINVSLIMNKINENRKALLIFIFIAILLGSYLRVNAVLSYNFPLNDGGLFYTMTQDLIDNAFQLPLYTSYNQDQIPFAYPPAAFYLLGFLNQAVKIDLISLFRFFPLICNILVLFLIFPIARIILGDDLQALFALFAYGIIGPSYSWLVMGGGVTRAPGQLFAMGAILRTLGYYRLRRRWVWLACAVLSISLSGYFHIETAWITALEMAFLAAWFERSRKTVIFLLANAAGGALLLSPYWLFILSTHGIGTFLSAFSAGYTDTLASIGLLVLPLYSAEVLFHILAVLGFLGIFASLAARKVLPVLLLLLLIITNPRSIQRSAVLPEALLIATCLDLLILQGLENVVRKTALITSGQARKTGRTSLPWLFTGMLIMYAFVLMAIQQNLKPKNGALTAEQRAGLDWIRVNTEEDAAFLVLPSHNSWASDQLSEWFPALAHRRSVLTVQGYEWTTPEMYQGRSDTFLALAACVASEDICYQDWKTEHGFDFDYLVVPTEIGRSCLASLQDEGLLDGCSQREETGDVIIYQCR